MAKQTSASGNDKKANQSSVEAELGFEQALEQLQETVERLESGELSLEDSLRCFEKGVQLTRLCQDRLTQAEKRIQILTQKENGSPQLEDFQSP